MVDMNAVITKNIMIQLNKQNKKQTELAEGIGVTRQVVNKILNGSRMVNAIELHRIADYFNISMEELVSTPCEAKETNVVRVFMGQVKTDAAREALAIADELADMILFHAKVRENSKAMMETWEI
ncbi:MAG: helix-turn-helix domain-containing protein [Lachnospiraceae bacterium]|nr:helix-turn-helix domain-containing protein [Lachnospiraceae bacterium]